MTTSRNAGDGARRRSRAAALALLAAVVSPAPAAADPPPGFVRLAELAPDIAEDMRYAGPDNFTGAPVPGYAKAECWLRAEAARALAEAEREAESRGFGLVVWDCYRPLRAVAAFMAWANTRDETTRAAHYPNVAKRALLGDGYIAKVSAHSTGLAVDLGVVGWDFGAPFDYFDPKSATAAVVAGAAGEHRATLVALMQKHGFANYSREWWHFSFASARNAPGLDAEIK